MKAVKAWAVVSPHGVRVAGVGLTQFEAWENAARNESYPASWLERNKDYICIRVTITAEEPPHE